MAQDTWRVVRYARTMRYPDGGGLTAAERACRERVRLAAASEAISAATCRYSQHLWIGVSRDLLITTL